MVSLAAAQSTGGRSYLTIMPTRHIHIRGLVQGVGFRPMVYGLATQLGLKGYVNNSSDGVHIVVTGSESGIDSLYDKIRNHPPKHAVITAHEVYDMPSKAFDQFFIAESEANRSTDLMITPDLGLCDTCTQELFDPSNRRHRYPFITCIHCGPRYSVMQSLPYDRCNTSMDPFDQCLACKNEYHNPFNRRYYSQTNSCSDCGVSMMLTDATGHYLASDNDDILEKVTNAFREGKIVAVKGIGGFLLMCDAQRADAIATLRQRKHRPSKPLALLYESVEAAASDVKLCGEEMTMLQSSEAPIVLCHLKDKPQNALPFHLLAPGLNRIGIMLPYAPLLALLTKAFHKPLVATSGNISHCPVIFANDEAREVLGGIADLILMHDRDIVTPQDDSVVQFTSRYKQLVMLRRSRGWAPGFYPSSLPPTDLNILAMGAELKSSFGIWQQETTYISQFLGDQGFYEAQKSYQHTLNHLSGMLHFDPDVLLADKHPGYEVTKLGETIAAEKDIPIIKIQHHEAHFAAVLAENDLLNTPEPVLGVAWDGTGYGHDGQIWGGECFVYHQGHFSREVQLSYFPVLMGDKMSREPRLSALSVSLGVPGAAMLLQEKFTNAEWGLYQAILKLPGHKVQTSSMGRLLDGIASLLGFADTVSFEGEAAMLLQAAAERASHIEPKTYPLPFDNGIVYWKPMIEAIMADLLASVPVEHVAYNVHYSLARLVYSMANTLGIATLAFSGGVFQNTLLIDLIRQNNTEGLQLYFHKQLSPNDECIAFGQMAWLAAKQFRTNSMSEPASVPYTSSSALTVT